jgi:hypothetical protein
MINYKKMNEKEFVFLPKTLSEKEEKSFSNFLKRRKLKSTTTRRLKKKRKSIQKQ